MATDNQILFELKLQGTGEAEKDLTKMEKKLHKLTKEQKEFNKTIKDKEKITKKEAQTQAKYKTKIQQTRTAMRQTRTEITATNAISRKLDNSYNSLVKRNKALTLATKKLADPLGKDAQQFKRLTAEINKNTQALKGMDSKMGNSFRNVGNYKSAISGLVGAFGVTAGATGLVMALKSTVGAMQEFEQRMATLSAITGASGKDLASLQKSAMDLGRATIFTASEVGQLQIEFSKLGFTTQQILDATEATLDLATATGEDLAESAIVASSTVRGFGLQAKDTLKVTDIMASAFTSSALDLTKFKTAMAVVGPVAKTSGASLERTTAIIAKVADAGIDASSAGTALRNIFLELSKQGLTFDEAMDKIRQSTNKNATAMELFGKRGATVATVIAKNEEGIKKLTTQLENSNGSARRMANTVGNTLQNDIKRLGSAWEGLVLTIMEGDGVVGDFLKFWVQGLTEIINLVTDLSTDIYKQSKAMENERIELNKLVRAITNVNTGEEKRKELISELNRINPEFLKGIDAQKVKNDELIKRLNLINKLMVKKIIIQKKADEIQEKANQQADLEIQLLKQQGEADEFLIKMAEEHNIVIDQRLDRGQQLSKVYDELFKIEQKRNKEEAKRRKNLSATQKILEGEAVSIDPLAKAKGSVSFLSGALNKTQRQIKELADETENMIDVRSELMKKWGIEEQEIKDDLVETVDAYGGVTDAVEETADAEDQRAKTVKKLLGILNNDIQRYTNERIAMARKEYIESQKLEESERMSKEELQDEITKIQLHQLILRRQMLVDYGEDTVKIDQQIADAKFSIYAEGLQREIKAKAQADKDKLDYDQRYKQQKRMLEQEAFSLLTNLNNSIYQLNVDRIDRTLEREQDALRIKAETGVITEADYNNQVTGLQKQAFKKKKQVDTGKAIMDGALAVMKTIAQIGGVGLITPPGAGLIALIVAQTALQVGMIQAQKFGRGGKIPEKFADGGMVQGKRHSQGGEKFAVGGRVVELEGGEAVINRKATQRHKGLLSQINQSTGGRKFADGGMVQAGPLQHTFLTEMSTGMIIRDINKILVGMNTRIDNIKVTNVVTDTTKQQNKLNNIESEAGF